jgi:heme-degrading monooxygenase HmoA
MFVVIFEVQPKQERWNDYLDLAKHLKPKLEAIDGFIDNERFESKRAKGRILSLSTWRDEKAVVRWRTEGEHHGVQERGRFEIFEDYRLRVGEVVDDSDPPPGVGIVEQRFDETANPKAKAATITEVGPVSADQPAMDTRHLQEQLGLDQKRDGLIDAEIFASIYNRGKLLLLAAWRDLNAASQWTPRTEQGFGAEAIAAAGVRAARHRRVRVIRDYGMKDRLEAPQFYPDVDRKRTAAAE